MKRAVVKKFFLNTLLLCLFLIAFSFAEAQCSICTRTAEQLGEKPAKGLNAGILYLAAAPLSIIGFLGVRWWKRNQTED